MEASVSVNIVLVTRDNLDCIKQSTADIFSKTSCQFDLLIIDNHSTRPEVLEYYSAIETRQDTRIIRLPKNLFYFPAVNVGLRQIRRENRYTLIANDDIVLESDKWVDYMIAVVESEPGIGYVGDFMIKPFSPPLGGWIDGWCMFFKTEVFKRVGLFDEEYIWWYSPADYLLRTLKKGYKVKDLKRPGDRHNHIAGIIRHLGGQTFSKIKDDPTLPLDVMFPPDFKFENLLLKHGFYRLYLRARLERRSRDDNVHIERSRQAGDK
jgi:GT2 family glycosyltransferase